ncbi:hypothetical protein LQZ21_12955, partial [Treponema sp. TIM-1]
MFAIDGCKLPSNASKEWSGTLKDLKKKQADLEKLGKQLTEQHQERDKRERSVKKLNKTCRNFIEGKEYQERHQERIAKKLAKLEQFLATAEAKQGIRACPRIITTHKYKSMIYLKDGNRSADTRE